MEAERGGWDIISKLVNNVSLGKLTAAENQSPHNRSRKGRLNEEDNLRGQDVIRSDLSGAS